MKSKSFKGLRYLCLVRASHSTNELSTNAQLELMHKEVAPLEMTHVGDIIKDGLTGSLPGKREELKKLIADKKSKNEFDVLVIQRCDRLTRSGSVHGMWFEFECRKVGIRVIYVGEQIPQGRHANFIKVLQFEAAQEQAFSISQRSTQGAQQALEQGRMMPVGRTPFGCWRLYCNESGKPSHIIRDLRDGRQQKLHVETHEVIDTYGEIGGGSKGHYKKQKSEKPFLMMGDKAEIEIVREIFHLHLIQGLGGKKISDILNRKGLLSPMGEDWSQRQIESIYENSSYTGCSVGDRISSAIYHERSPNTPKLVELDEQLLATADRIPNRHRPMEEWFFMDQPYMHDFLEPNIRGLAIAEHRRIWEERNNPHRVKKPKKKHNPSDYLLSGLFFAKQDGGPLVGILCGRVNKRTRYYRHRRGRKGYQMGSVYNGMFRAEPLEQAILELLADLLTDIPNLREQIIAHIQEQAAALAIDSEQIEEFRKRREQIGKRIELIMAMFDDEAVEEAALQVKRLNTERQNLDEQIKAAHAQEQMRNIDPQKIADEILGELLNISVNWKSMPMHALRQLLETFVEKAVGNMETKDVEVALKLPTWAFGQKNADSMMRTAPNSRSSVGAETHQPMVIKLGYADCKYRQINQQVCYECRRRKAA